MEGLGKGKIEAIQLNCKNDEGIINLVYNLKCNKCSQINSDFDDHATGAIRCDAHCPIEHVCGFM